MSSDADRSIPQKEVRSFPSDWQHGGRMRLGASRDTSGSDFDEPGLDAVIAPGADLDDSEFEPPSTEEDEDEHGNPLPHNARAGLGQENRTGDDASYGTIKREPEEDVSTFPSRGSSPLHWAPYKRYADAPTAEDRPFKRVKSKFNHDYLNLLNIDIYDAATRYVPHEKPELECSQLGLSIWSSTEKEMFFEALARLGRDDIKGISRRVRSKSPLEVQQYLTILRGAVNKRKYNGSLETMYPFDYPAAVEVSPQCCQALEDAADAVALRQERHEQTVEEKRWGDNWLITPFNYQSIQASNPEDMPFIGLFRISSWLQLSERIFMNASYPEGNWQELSEDNPAIRATAFEDFYSLAVSITKRLVSATLYTSASRIQAKQAKDSRTKIFVRPADVEAAALSIGLKPNKQQFWAGCARRLRLAVYDDRNGESDEEPENNTEPDFFLAYDAVEAALGGVVNSQSIEEDKQEMGTEIDESEPLSDTSYVYDSSDEEEEPSIATIQSPLREQPAGPEVDEDEVKQESKELLLYTAFDHPRTTHVKQAVESRIRSELQHVAHADAVDSYASYQEERRLWTMLGYKTPSELTKAEPSDSPPRRTHTVDELLPSRADWREKLTFVSEWEAASQ
ncbi:hypothetical protein VTK73DRAFT_8345 [Phialemonium thermophilum]|uniref:SANT domain-containing protein n=1 Tax=Phialemonium thermophilum TaxID=223376 RepID=A0ABR3Y6B0_9PEZI